MGRNIVHIILDCLRADHCGFMGYSRETTPTLDKMAKKGLVFENAIAHSIATLPSVVGMITGKYPVCESNSNKRADWLNELRGRILLAESLKKLGYATVALQPNPRLSSYYGINRGFDYYWDFISVSKDVEIVDSSIFSELKKFIKREAGYLSWDKFYDIIIQLRDQVKEPYYMWIHLMDTHAPYSTVPRKYKKWCRKPNIYLDFLRLKRVKLGLSNTEKKIYVDAYDDCIRYSDVFLKKLFKDLSDDDPVFVIHADHGEEFWEHGGYGHIDVLKLYDELIHVPLVIYNFDGSDIFDKPILLFEVRKLIINNIAMDKSVDPEKYHGDEFVISKVFDKGVRKIAVRSKVWKFISWENNYELYNLSNDPGEQCNLFGNLEYSNLYNSLNKLIRRHIMSESEERAIRSIKFRTKL